MTTSNAAPTSGTPEPLMSEATAEALKKALVDCGPDRKVLKDKFDASIKALMDESITRIEQAYPHGKGDNSANKRQFDIHRGAILNKGNALIREFDKALGCFITHEVIRREEVQKVVFSNPGEPPVGVRIRSV